MLLTHNSNNLRIFQSNFIIDKSKKLEILKNELYNSIASKFNIQYFGLTYYITLVIILAFVIFQGKKSNYRPL